MINTFSFPLSLVIWVHILGGILALITFNIPLLSGKGGRLHAQAGWVYAGAMVLVALSTFIIAPWRIFIDPERTTNTQTFSVFLFLIAVFSLSTLQQGIVVFKFKYRSGRDYSIKTLGSPIVVMVISMLTILVGLKTQNWLHFIFGILTMRTALKQISYWHYSPVHTKDWWFYHLENMFICCIATVTAFVVTALPRIFPATVNQSIIIWLSPTVIMVPWMMWFKNKYEKKYGLK